MQEKEAVWQEIRNRVFQNMDLSGEISDKELKRMIAEEVRQFGKVHLLSLQARETCEEQIFNSFRKLDILQELLDDPEVTEIMVNGAAHIFMKTWCALPMGKGQLSEERLRDMIQQMVGAADRIVNEAQPIVDTRLPDGSRVNIVLQPVSLDGSCIQSEILWNTNESCVSGAVRSYIRGSGGAAETAGKGGIQYFYFRRDRFRKDDISQCTFGIYTRGGACHYHRRFCRTSVEQYKKSGAA